jgi:hypothetical protein
MAVSLTFLVKPDYNAAARAFYFFLRRFELLAAIALHTVKNMARNTS